MAVDTCINDLITIYAVLLLCIIDSGVAINISVRRLDSACKLSFQSINQSQLIDSGL